MNKDLILREKLAVQRSFLANQSTFLAFLRTSMYFLVAGITINNVTTIKYGTIIEILFVTISVVLLFVGTFNYYNFKKKISESQKHIGDFKDEYFQE